MLALGDLGPADGTGPSQTQQQLALQRGARLDGQDLVDRLVRHPTSVILRTAELLPASDLLGRPVLAELARDELAQRWVQSVLAPLRASGVIRRSPVSLSSAVSASPAMTRYLATHRRGRPARPARNRAGDRTEIEADALGLRRGRLRRPPALPGRARNARRRRGRRDWPRGSASPPTRQRCRTTTESAPRSQPAFDAVNAHFARIDQIKRFAILDRALSNPRASSRRHDGQAAGCLRLLPRDPGRPLRITLVSHRCNAQRLNPGCIAASR